MKNTCILLLLLSFSTTIFAQSPLVLEESSQKVYLNGYLSLKQENDSLPKSSPILLQYAKEKGSFEPLNTTNLNFNYQPHWNWVRLPLQYVGKDECKAKTFYLLLDKPTVQYIHFVLIENDSIIYESKTGIDYPFFQRPREHSNFYVFDLPLKPNQNYTVLVCLRNHLDNLNTNVLLLNDAEFRTFESTASGAIAFILGIIFLTFFASSGFVIAFWSVRNRYANFIFYPIYSLCVFLNILSHEGIAYRYLWWGSPAMAMLSKCVFIILGGSAFIWFLYAIFKDWNSKFTQRYRYFAIVSSTLLGLFLLLYIVAMLFWWEAFGRLIMQGYNVAIALMLLGSLFSIVYYVIRVENKESFAVRFLLVLAVFLVVIMGVVIFLNNLVNLNFIKNYLPNFIQNAFAVPRYWTWMFFLGELIVSIGILIFKLVYIHRELEKQKKELEAQIAQRTKEKEDLFAQLRELTSRFEKAKENEEIKEIIDEIEEVEEAINDLEEDIEELDKKITPTDYEVQDVVLALTETNLRKTKFDIFNDITAIAYISKGKYGKDKPKAIAIKLFYKNRTNMLQSNRFVLIAIFIIQNELSNTDTNLEDLYDFGISNENNRTNNSIGNMFSRYIGVSFKQFKTDIRQAITNHKLTTVEEVRTWVESQKIEETGVTKYAIVSHWAKRDKVVQYQKTHEAGKKPEKFW
ncbi:MAG: hypothetical protein EAZ95_12815 [Bacteroidetes bacterium]|nr:MAG: hypothetical protein EAZ95_12815 [Bacteroidota bacterium]